MDEGKGGSKEKRQGRRRAIEVGGRNEKKRERDKQYINKNVRDGGGGKERLTENRDTVVSNEKEIREVKKWKKNARKGS